MADPELQAKWEVRYRDTGMADLHPCRVLEENRHLLPASGTALDLACGLGGNAVFLARHGLQTRAWDLSTTAIDKLKEFAARQQLTIEAQSRDVVTAPPDAESFDVIVVSHFLERALCPVIAKALKPGGLLFYQTFTRDKADAGGPQNPAYRLAQNELLQLFSGLDLLVYREEGRTGDITQGFRNEAMLVGRRKKEC